MQLSKSVDNLCLYDPGFKYVANHFLSDLGGSSDIHEVSSMEDLTTALNGYKGVKFLEIVLHGSMGSLHIGKKIMDASYIADVAKDNINLLQRNAQILFDSCSVGKGNMGDKFMDRLGAMMLRGKGGVIGAPTVDNISHPVFQLSLIHMMPLSGGRLKVRRYDENGKLVAARQVDRHGIER